MKIYNSIFTELIVTDYMVELLKACNNGEPDEIECKKLGYNDEQLNLELELFKKHKLVTYNFIGVTGLSKNGERVIETVKEIE